MSGPPKDIADFDLFTRLSTAERPYELVDFPRLDPTTGEPVGKVAIVVLKEQEILQAQAAATKFAHENLQLRYAQNEPDAGYCEVLNNALASEILQRAVRKAIPDPDAPGSWIAKTNLPVFVKAGDMRANLTHDEISCLYNSYAIVQRNLGPIASSLSKDECDAWLDKLEKGGSKHGLAFFSLGALIDLVQRSVERIAISRTEQSSAGSLPGDTLQS